MKVTKEILKKIIREELENMQLEKISLSLGSKAGQKLDNAVVQFINDKQNGLGKVGPADGSRIEKAGDDQFIHLDFAKPAFARLAKMAGMDVASAAELVKNMVSEKGDAGIFALDGVRSKEATISFGKYRNRVNTKG